MKNSTQSKKLKAVLSLGTFRMAPDAERNDALIDEQKFQTRDLSDMPLWVFEANNEDDFDFRTITQFSNNPFTLIDLVYTFIK